jgi:hypothetical protein
MTMHPDLRRHYPAAPAGTYVVCLDRGKELPYDWDQMKLVRKLTNCHHVRNLVAEEAR